MILRVRPSQRISASVLRRELPLLASLCGLQTRQPFHCLVLVRAMTASELTPLGAKTSASQVCQDPHHVAQEFVGNPLKPIPSRGPLAPDGDLRSRFSRSGCARTSSVDLCASAAAITARVTAGSLDIDGGEDGRKRQPAGRTPAVAGASEVVEVGGRGMGRRRRGPRR